MAQKLMIVPGATFNCDVTEGSQSFRLNYSTPSDAQIEEGVARLGKVARRFLA
jgi:2-aminoadipate transaminase